MSRMQYAIYVMFMGEAFKVVQKEEKKPVHEIKKEIFTLLDEDEVEIKRLSMDDIEECVKVMRKCTFDVTASDLSVVIKYGVSFGAYVNRMMVGAGLAWLACFDFESKQIVQGTPNALYLEDPAVLIAYEGRGVRKSLILEREKEAKSQNLTYLFAYLTDPPKKENIEGYIKEASSSLESMYYSLGFQFLGTPKGLIAFKKL